MPNHGLRPRPADLFSSELARIWLVTDTRRNVRRDVIGLFNWKEHEPVEIDSALSWIGLPEGKRFVGYDYWADRFVPPFADRLRCTLAPGSCRVLAVRPESDHPQLVSTSRHITQGIVDVLEERWNRDDLALHGGSRVVGGDPYELRILVPVGAESYLVVRAEASSADRDGVAQVEFDQAGPKVRVRIEAATSATVDWKVRFRRGAVEVPAPQAVEGLKADVACDRVVLE
jgi:hypothetical protein